MINKKIFLGISFINLLIYFFLVLWVFDVKSPGIGEGSVDFGFPFTYYFETCFGRGFSVLGIIGNLIVGVFISLASAALSIKAMQYVTSSKFQGRFNLR